jgi:hypothetical protein
MEPDGFARVRVAAGLLAGESSTEELKDSVLESSPCKSASMVGSTTCGAGAGAVAVAPARSLMGLTYPGPFLGIETEFPTWDANDK